MDEVMEDSQLTCKQRAAFRTRLLLRTLVPEIFVLQRSSTKVGMEPGDFASLCGGDAFAVESGACGATGKKPITSDLPRTTSQACSISDHGQVYS